MYVPRALHFTGRFDVRSRSTSPADPRSSLEVHSQPQMQGQWRIEVRRVRPYLDQRLRSSGKRVQGDDPGTQEDPGASEGDGQVGEV